MSRQVSRREFLKTTGLGAAATAALTALGPGRAAAGRADKSQTRRGGKRPPNIVYVILDEIGYYELSCMGHEVMQTPTMDRLAKEGIRFTQLLAGAPVCAPTRSCLMTGQHMGHTSVRSNGGFAPLRADDVTVASVLAKAGYATGGFGKWGCGGRGTTGVPEKHGFDVFFGYYDQVHAHTFFPAYLIRNSKEVPLEGNEGYCYEGKTYSQYEIFKESLKFIRENKAKPFFCYCPWTPPHGLWGMPKDEPSLQKYKDKPWKHGQGGNDSKVYAAMVNMVDRQIGQILLLLKELKIADNTIVFVTGDNGGARYFGDAKHPHGFFGPNVDPRTKKVFRGFKGSLYEGGLRVPFIVNWPGRIKPGRVSKHLSYFPDIMPTLAELAGGECPKDIDGISIVPTLLGKEAAGREQKQHEYLYWEYGGSVAVRMGNWKTIKPRRAREFELYDLSKDIEEKTNVAADHPEILAKMVAFAKQAHTPVRPGKVLDREICMKDHSKTRKRKKRK